MRRSAGSRPYFGGAFSLGQEVVLAVSLARAGFDQILAAAVPSSYAQVDRYPNRATWSREVKRSNVRLQWDPDHGPSGSSLDRRAIQLGLRGPVLADYARPWIRGIEDITAFVVEQHAAFRKAGSAVLVTPREEVYPCDDATQVLGLDRPS